MKLSELKINPNNPRLIKDDKFKKLVKSIEDFPKMMELRPIIIDDQNMILGGNMRYKALQHLNFKDIPDSWIKKASELTEEQKREFIIKDNVSFGLHDWDALANEWNEDELKDWGVDLPVDWDEESKEEKEAEAQIKLQEKFIVPPFSILDTRQGYWQDRKRYWKTLIQDEGETREGALSEAKLMTDINNGVSLLDPVLAELANKWFGLPTCKTFDPFAGDSVFGYVSDYLGNTFTGVELRQEQTDLNNERLKGSKSKYICDDGQNVLSHIEENSQDLLFSCPPYFDLEVYSDLKNDASNQKEYKDFLQILDNAFSGAIKCLKDNRFAVITVGDIRNKQGFYYGFVDDIKAIFNNNGLLI